MMGGMDDEPRLVGLASSSARHVADGEAAWHYIDVHGVQQGPYHSATMRAWYEQGFFAPSLLVAQSPSCSFERLEELWREPEFAFTGTSGGTNARGDADEFFIGPSGPPRGYKRPREGSSPDVGPQAAAVPSPAVDVQTASLLELYTDRLSSASSIDPWPPPPRRFEHYERVDGSLVNIVDGLAMHYEVLSAGEQRHVLKFVQRLRELGAEGRLSGRTYSAPSKWRKGNGRITVQLGCCYNYAGYFSRDGRWEPAGILPEQRVESLPPLLHDVIDRCEGRGIFSADTRPDTCIVNFYEEGDCIPPHIDSHDFARPFVTLSLLSEQRMVLGKEIQVLGDGEFDAPIELPLPVGSVLVLDGNGADVAKHCIPSVRARRVSITFRRIGDAKREACHSGEPAAPNALSAAAAVLPTCRDRDKKYGVPVVGFREPWLEKVELGEKTCDGRLGRDRICRNLRAGDHFVGVSAARHLLLRVEADATYHDSFGSAWAAHGDELVPPSIAAVRSADEAQRLWERMFNDGVPKAPQLRAVLVLGVSCVCKLE